MGGHIEVACLMVCVTERQQKTVLPAAIKDTVGWVDVHKQNIKDKPPLRNIERKWGQMGVSGSEPCGRPHVPSAGLWPSFVLTELSKWKTKNHKQRLHLP